MGVVVLGVTGCIGAYKACELLRELQRARAGRARGDDASATRFVTPMTFEALSQHPVFVDQFALGRTARSATSAWPTPPDLLLVAPGHRQRASASSRTASRTTRSRTLCARDQGAGRWWRRP